MPKLLFAPPPPMMFAIHEMDFAREVADKVCFLQQGIVYEEGPPSRIFGNPQGERTTVFLKRIMDAGRL